MRALRFLFLCVLLCAGCQRPNPFENEAPAFTWQLVNAEFNPNATLVAAENGTLFAIDLTRRRLIRSGDGGAAWALAFEVPANWHRFTGLVAAGPDNAVYATVGRRDGGGDYSAFGLYRSADGGETWEAASVPGQALRAMAVSTQGNLYLGTNGTGRQGVMRSSDAGGSWAATPAATASSSFGGGVSFSRALRAGPRGVLLAQVDENLQDGRHARLFRSDDDGRRWTELPMPPRPEDAFSFGYSVGRRGRVYAFTADRLFSVPAGSGNWVETAWPASGLDLVVNRHEHLYVAAGFDGVFRSTDLGATWEEASEGLPRRNDGRLVTGVNRLLIDGEGYVYAVTTSGLFRSEITLE